MDDKSMQFGLLMESAQAHQESAHASLERLTAHTRDLDVIVRQAIRHTLTEELRVLNDAVNEATLRLRMLRQSVDVRNALWSGAAAIVCVAISLIVGWSLLPTPQQITALRAQRDLLVSNIARLEQQGGRLELRRCGPDSRLCVRVDRRVHTYGDQGDFFVVKGY